MQSPWHHQVYHPNIKKDACSSPEVPISSWEDAACCHNPPVSELALYPSKLGVTEALTNSDLEMAAVVLQFNVLLEPLVPSMNHKLMQIHSDNTPSVAWLTRMATKAANSDAAHRLVQGLALCQRMLHSAPMSITHVAGSDNN